MLHRLLLGERRVGLGELCLEDVDLLLGDGDNRDVALQRGLLFANVGLRLLRSSARCRSRSSPDRCSAGNPAAKRRAPPDPKRPAGGLLDRRASAGRSAGRGVDAGLRRRDIGARLVERGLVIARIDAREHLARLHRLVVVDRHLGDVARHLGADQDRMRLHIGIIGRDQKAAGRPVVVAVTRRRREQQRCRRRDQQPLQRPPAAPDPCRGLVDGAGIANEV